MDVYFVIAQCIGGIALFILVLSLQKNEKEKLLKYQVLSSLLYALQYLFLNALTGCFMNLACMCRNFIFYQYQDRKVPFYWLMITLFFMVGLSLVSYQGIISLFPMLAVVLYSIALWYGNVSIIRVVEVVSCSFFVIYNIVVLAIMGLIATIIELVAALWAIYRFDIRNKKA